MAGLDVSHLSPSDAVAALRSFPRRYRALLTTFDDDEKPDDLVHRAGPDGLSAVDHVEHVARSVAMLDRALHDVLQQDDVVLSPATFDDAARDWQVASGDPSLDAALDFLTVECEALADAVERVLSRGMGSTGEARRRWSFRHCARHRARSGAHRL